MPYREGFGWDTQDVYDQYMNEMGRATRDTPLSRSEEFELWQRMEDGRQAKAKLADVETTGIVPYAEWIGTHGLANQIIDGREAAATFLTENLRLGVDIASSYARHKMEPGEVTQVATLGLIRAVEKFDARKGFKFSTYAMKWIRQFIRREAMIDLSVHVPHERRDDVWAVEAMRTAGFNDDDIMEWRHLTSEELTQVDHDGLMMRTSSLDTPLSNDGSEDGGGTLSDLVPATETEVSFETAIGRVDIENLIGEADLTEREIFILYARYGINGVQPIPNSELRAKYGISGFQNDSLHKSALQKIRYSLGLVDTPFPPKQPRKNAAKAKSTNELVGAHAA